MNSERHNYLYREGKIIGDQFVYTLERRGRIMHYTVGLKDGNRTELAFELLENHQILDTKYEEDELIIFFREKITDNHYKIGALSWNFIAQHHKELFTYTIKEDSELQSLYYSIHLEGAGHYFVYNYGAGDSIKKVLFFKYSENETPALKFWNLKGKNLNHQFSSYRTAVIDGKLIYSNSDTLYAFDSETNSYPFIKVPSPKKPIENLKVSSGFIVLSYDDENRIVDSETGQTLLKPERFNLLFHPSKPFYFDRPVGNLNTLAIRDLSSGQMLCEADVNFSFGGYQSFYDSLKDQVVLLMVDQIVVLQMPEEL